MSDFKQWVSDQLTSLLGYLQPILVQYVIASSKKASSPSEIFNRLIELGASRSVEEASLFAKEIFARVAHKSSQPNDYQHQEREAKNFVQKQKSYKILEAGDGDGDDVLPAALVHKKEKSKVSKKAYQHEEREAKKFAQKQKCYKILEAGDGDGDDVLPAASVHRNEESRGQKVRKRSETREEIDYEEEKYWSQERRVRSRCSHARNDGSEVNFYENSSLEYPRTPVDETPFDKIQNERKALPIYPYRDDFLNAVNDYQVIVVVGETGSGKTTQIPQYLHEAGYTRRGRIGCTQPRRVAALSVAARVSHEMSVKLGNEVGYSIQFDDCTSNKTVLKYMTDGMLLREFISEPDLASYSVVMVDEAHERKLSTDILFVLLKELVRYRSDLKLIISSATLDAVKFSDYFDHAPIFNIPGRQYGIEIYYLKKVVEGNKLCSIAVGTILRIHKTQRIGNGEDILVFLTGKEEIHVVEKNLNKEIAYNGSKMPELIICPLYAKLPEHLQHKVFEPTPEGARKVVLATNIAEMSLTVEGIKYVIDSGFCKMKSYNPRDGMESLLPVMISKASANQRAGRCGRTSPGKCFRLYTAHQFYNELDANTVPEIQRVNLASAVLTLKCIGINDVMKFDFMDPPPSEALLKALELLYALSAVDKHGKITKVGRMMARLPLDPMVSKMIVASDKYKCSEEILTIASMLSAGNSFFYRPLENPREADIAHGKFEKHTGDLIVFLRVYILWKESKFSTEWCFKNYIQVRSMKRARDIRDKLKELLPRVGIALNSNRDLVAIKKAITSGFFPHAATINEYHDRSYLTVKGSNLVHVDPKSSFVALLPCWIMYHELVKTHKVFIRQVTRIEPEWLLEIAPHYYERNEVESRIKKRSFAPDFSKVKFEL